MVILGIHELSHYLAAVRYKIRTTLPYFIPIPFFLGTFGAFIQMKSRIPNRKALFDVAIAGPLGGFIVTVPLLIWGLKLSGVVQLVESSRNFLNFQAINPRFSLLFTLFSKLALGDQFTVDKAILLHPLAIAGYIGLIVTALNLMPIGQLDGGHIVHAVYGQRIAVLVGYFTRMVMILALLRPEFLLWAILLFLIPVADQPALNDVTELDNGRDLLGLLSIGLLLLILLPVPSIIAQWLNV
jgi:membrane-associated protease RseP (regulator of RpoE activity)